MPHNRSPKPTAKWYLPKAEYKYVVAFCMTYDELRRRLVELNTALKSPEMDGMPHGTDVSNPTESIALQRLKVSQKLMLIEQAVLECAGSKLYRPMLTAITRENMPLWKIKLDFDVEMGHMQFSNLRRQIYFTIAKHL